jgi:hypothetical protein
MLAPELSSAPDFPLVQQHGVGRNTLVTNAQHALAGRHLLT